MSSTIRTGSDETGYGKEYIGVAPDAIVFPLYHRDLFAFGPENVLYWEVTPTRVLLFSKEENIKKIENRHIWWVIVALIVSTSPASASALSVKNNLSIKQVKTIPTSQEVFLISTPKNIIKSNKNLKTLEKYQDSAELSDRDLKGLLRAVGFKGTALKEAWAIAKRESNGQPIRFNGNKKTGDSSYGLFQINMIGALKNSRKLQYKINYTSDLLNPVINAQIAFHMSNGGEDWSAWHGMTSKAKDWLKKFPN